MSGTPRSADAAHDRYRDKSPDKGLELAREEVRRTQHIQERQNAARCIGTLRRVGTDDRTMAVAPGACVPDASDASRAEIDQTPSFSAAIRVPRTRLAIFWKATSRA